MLCIFTKRNTTITSDQPTYGVLPWEKLDSSNSFCPVPLPYAYIPIRKLNSVNFAFVKWLRLQHFKNSIVLIWPCHKTSKQILIPLMLQSWNTVNVPNVLNCCLFIFLPLYIYFFSSDFVFSVTYIDCDIQLQTHKSS